jgi:homocysteine S-methyltransferase
MFPLSRNFLKERNTVARQAKYRERLPQLGGGLFLTDGGLETTLIFREGWELPRFEAFVLLNDLIGRMVLRAYFDRYVLMAIEAGAGFILESPTWRANPEWAVKAGYGRADLARVNRAAIELMHEIRDRYETQGSPLVVSGAIGPRGDGYDPGALMSREEAADYHGFQIGLFRDAGADLVSAFTMTNIAEAQGVALTAKAATMPCVISFTVETDGRLPTGDTLAQAIKSVDEATRRPIT